MLNLGQVGIGQWGQNLLRTFSNLSNCSVKIVCDQNQDTLAKTRQLYNQRIKITSDFKDLLKDPDIDAIIIASPPVTHAELAVQALSAGKHVFVEKPLALNVSDAEKMITLSEERKRTLMVGHLLLYHPAVKKLKTTIDSGDLGEIHYLYSTRVNLGRVREEENALWSLTAHDISVAMHLLEESPTQVTTTGSAYVRKEIQDVVFVNLRFGNEVMSHVHASWLDPHKIRKFTVVGSKKMAVFDDMETAEKLRLYDKGVNWQKNGGTYDTFLTIRHGDVHIPKIDMMEPLKLECAHFVESILENKPVFSDGKNGLAVLKVLGAAQESLESNGKPIHIE